MIRITAKKDGFRRGGVAHPAKATDYADDRFTKAELKALAAEPMLTVEVLDDEAKGGGKKTGKKPAQGGTEE